MQNLAEVRLWGKLLGALVYQPQLKMCSFEYAPEWLQQGVEVAPLHLPSSSEVYQFPGLNQETYKGLPALFTDSLPDDFGNAVINDWLARNGRDVGSVTVLERLLYIGKRGMGALEFEPATGGNQSSAEKIELGSLVTMAQQILDRRAKISVPLTTETDEQSSAMSTLFQVGTSAGGARAKALVAVNDERTQIRSGQTDAPEGFDHYLLKFDGVEERKINSEVFSDPKGFGRMEYAYYLMAKDAGINMMHSELLMDGLRAHFMTKRFDRNGNKKRHYVSLCAMDHADYKKPGTYSYEQLLAVARQLRLPREDAIEIYRRMVFNVVSRNHDDHSKNFGFLLASPTAKWRLSPAFDVVYSYKKDSPWVNAHQLSLNGKRDNFSKSDLLAVGNLIGNFSKMAKQIIEDVIAVVTNWDNYAQQAGVFDELAFEIKHNHRVKL